MKTLLKISSLLLLAGFLFIGCKGKDGEPGPAGINGQNGATGATGNSGPSAMKYAYTLTFGPTLPTGQVYAGIPPIGANDIILTYILYSENGGNPIYTLLPLTNGGIYYYASNDSFGNVIVNLLYANGNAGSPLASNNTFTFYSVVIKGAAGLRKASIDYSNFEDVKAYYKL